MHKRRRQVEVLDYNVNGWHVIHINVCAYMYICYIANKCMCMFRKHFNTCGIENYCRSVQNVNEKFEKKT